VRFSDFSPHATGFSQMTIFPERRIYSAKILEGASPDAPNFSAVREHCPTEKSFTSRQSPIAIRCRFRLGRSLALPFFSSLVPSEVGAQVLRHQQTEIRSMVWSWLHRQPQEFTA
jgi:hypothetical protein